MFYTYLYFLLIFVPYFQIDSAMVCTCANGQDRSFFAPWIGFISLISVGYCFDFLIFLFLDFQ